jgi:hypothetical protein
MKEYPKKDTSVKKTAAGSHRIVISPVPNPNAIYSSPHAEACIDLKIPQSPPFKAC